MYPNLDNLVKPFAMKEGRTFKLFLFMTLLFLLITFLMISSGSSWENDKKTFVAIGFFAVIYAIGIPMGKVLTARRIKKLFQGFSREQLHRMEIECTQITPICGVAVTSQALISEMSMIPISDIVWIWPQNDTIKGVATMNFLTVADKHQKQYRILLSTKAGPFRQANKELVQAIEDMIRKYSPGIYWGYNKELAKMYRKNFSQMAAHVEQEYQKHSSFA